MRLAASGRLARMKLGVYAIEGLFSSRKMFGRPALPLIKVKLVSRPPAAEYEFELIKWLMAAAFDAASP